MNIYKQIGPKTGGTFAKQRWKLAKKRKTVKSARKRFERLRVLEKHALAEVPTPELR